MSRTLDGGPARNNISPAAILPLLSGAGDQRLLFEWVDSHERYTLVDPDQPLETAEFDCCILDGEALETHADELRRRKQEAEPVLLPCLLLLPETDMSVLDVDRGEIADGVVFETVDEVVSMPIKKVELEWRTEALLRLRSQSLELQQKQDKLRQFKRATESAGHAVYITDADGTIEYVNPAFEEMTGYDASEAIGERPALLDAGEMDSAHFDNLWETISAGDVWEEEILNERKDGERYHAYQTIAPVTDDTGSPDKFVAIQSDITQRVEAEQRLETFRDIVERIDDPIMLQDLDGKFQLVNEGLTTYADHSKAELMGETESLFMDEKSATRIEARKEQVLQQERAVQYTISPDFPETDAETFSTVRYPYYETDGTLAGTIAICRNVTDLESREEQLQVMDRVLRHNLRNDMTTVGMFAQRLADSLSGELSSNAERIHKTSRKVNQMIEKQRKITKFLTKDPRLQSIDLARLVDTVVRRLSDQYPQADISYSTPNECTVRATMDLEEAVIELAENAIVHSDQDSPNVRVDLDCSGEATLVITDDGPGIPEMDRQVLAHGTGLEQLYHGSGIGLWLVHLIVTHSEGTVSVEDNDPRGTVVTIQFPME
jgi:PAS domain S-box-containing protein